MFFNISRYGSITVLVKDFIRIELCGEQGHPFYFGSTLIRISNWEIKIQPYLSYENMNPDELGF